MHVDRKEGGIARRIFALVCFASAVAVMAAGQKLEELNEPQVSEGTE